MEAKIQLSKDEQGKAVNSTVFKSLIGGLRYLVHTRPDIAFSVGIVSRYMESPTTLHMNSVKRILRYVKGKINYGLVYEQGTENYLLSGYSDSDMGESIEDRKSTGGIVFYLNDSLITWVSQKQKCVALSSCEAEFMAANAAACQGVWLSKLLSQTTGKKLDPVVIYIDNKLAIDLTKNAVFHGRSKHIDIRFHFIRGCVERGEIQIKFINSGEQCADILTKVMTAVKFERMRDLLGIKNLQIEV
ncbi:secreted RxLR effector protein 161-like [Apium graveolens]|uniref:secreted RxLR effector protein 161-like n=1 Tax=Apium graveolens TaxID=4045 RepID=UPI003D7A7F61